MRLFANSHKTVLTYGRFDHLCEERVKFLRHAARLGDRLIVGCATDDYASAFDRPCETPYALRRDMLRLCRFVSAVIPLASAGQERTDIVNYNASLLVTRGEENAKAAQLQDIVQTVHMPRLHAPQSEAALWGQRARTAWG